MKGSLVTSRYSIEERGTATLNPEAEGVFNAENNLEAISQYFRLITIKALQPLPGYLVRLNPQLLRRIA